MSYQILPQWREVSWTQLCEAPVLVFRALLTTCQRQYEIDKTPGSNGEIFLRGSRRGPSSVSSLSGQRASLPARFQKHQDLVYPLKGKESCAREP